MKKILLYFLIGISMLSYVACESIEERNELDAAMSVSQLENYMDVTVNGNNVTCKVISHVPNVFVYWKTRRGGSNADSIDFYYPLACKDTVFLMAYGGAEKVVAKKVITIEQNDPEYFSDEKWLYLTNQTGKTWVWDDKAHSSGYVWGNNGYLATTGPGWWGVTLDGLAGQGGTPEDEITFSMDGDLKFSVSSAGNKPGSGSGTFDMKLTSDYQLTGTDGNIWSYGKIYFSGHTIPLGFEPNASGKPYHYTYDIIKLTEDNMVLAFPSSPTAQAWGEAWFYNFKRKGYTYTK